MGKAKVEPIGIEPSDTIINAGDAPDTSGVDSGKLNEIDGIAVVEPVGTVDSAGAVKRARGRPAGSVKPKSGSGVRGPHKEKAAAVSVKGIEKVLYSLHMMAAKITSIQELELDQDESKVLAESVTEVASHYNAVVDPKIIAWMGLFGVCGMLYGPRIAAYKMRRAVEGASNPKKSKAAPTPAYDPNSPLELDAAAFMMPAH